VIPNCSGLLQGRGRQTLCPALNAAKCISPNECIFFISQNEKFDYVADASK